jgi:hypothetical protein
VIGRARRRAAVSEATEIGGDHTESVSQVRGDSMPHQVCLGNPMQQEERWTLTAGAPVDRCPGGGQIELLELVEQSCSPFQTRSPLSLSFENQLASRERSSRRADSGKRDHEERRIARPQRDPHATSIGADPHEVPNGSHPFDGRRT